MPQDNGSTAYDRPMRDLERSYDIILEAFGDALDLRDTTAGAHSKRVTSFSIALCRAMGISMDKTAIIARAAFLHDLGKLAIPDDILFSRGRLSPAEMEVMRDHCYKGYLVLRKIPFLQEAAEIVYSHHERWDGTGYPRGQKGEDIPLGARIIAVTEALDTICSHQPYRPAQPFSVARDEIRRWSGKQFDPNVAQTFLSIPERIWSDLRRQIDSQRTSLAE